MRTFFEDVTYGMEDWLDLLDLSKADFLEIASRGVFEMDKNGSFRLSYVGAILTNNQLIWCLPKCLAKNAYSPNFKYLIQRSLQEYFRRKEKNRSIYTEDVREVVYKNNRVSKLFEIYNSLLQYFHNFGLYTKDNTELVNNASNKINWPRTISQNDIVLTNGSALYYGLVGSATQQCVSPITYLHASVLHSLSLEFSSLEDNIVDELTPYSESLTLSRIDVERDYWSGLIASELCQRFDSDSVNLLNTLLDFLRIRRDLDGPSSFFFYGTNRFEYVWEDVCSVAVGQSCETGTLLSPQWNFTDEAPTGSHKRSGGAQRPDVVFGDGSRVFILDAKYYFPLPEKICGWSDVVKQLFYARTYRTEGNPEIKNYFVFPGRCHSGSSVARVANVELIDQHGKVDKEFPPIEVLLLDPEVAFRKYINNQRIENLASKLMA